MRNVKKELLTALVAAIKAALPTIPVTTKRIDSDTSDVTAYPYIYIGDVYQTENGPKPFYIYEIELLIQIVYKNQSSLTDLYATQNIVLGIFNHPKPFSLTGNFEIMENFLVNSNDTEIQSETGTLNVGLIRMRFMIEDKN